MIRRLIRFVFRWVFRLVLLATLIVAAGRWVVPPITITQAVQWREQGELQRDWRDLGALGPMGAAAIAAEDARFCAHHGLDFDAIREAMADDRRRGGSTISQQVAKNVYLWQAPSWTRKGLEAAITLMIEATWPKARILEVYLNVAETGRGVFGAQAAARHWFGVDAADLSAAQAARIAAILPNPRERNAARPSEFVAGRARAIADGARTLAANGGLRCLAEG
ncbi:monofunctional biosynthetic peptidoglycan transglycosylase [Roseobacter sp. HKCCA0434]|uniref:monofunctional biosynthetic peptidoglycan transglycosylase n=1 Tax=Roseobacter sp. HKCCA0434 TaxID=3079297 RepID=UPI002905DB62|nr:monofunctional biosynthetic peptidoglycan transglycosylase [Roseobacter sp. HKCCA0434]